MWSKLVIWLSRRKYGLPPPIQGFLRVNESDPVAEEMFAVELSNSPSTPMDLVVYILTAQLLMSYKDAIDFMLRVHTESAGVIGRLPESVAISTCSAMSSFASANGHNLRCRPVQVRQIPQVGSRAQSI